MRKEIMSFTEFMKTYKRVNLYLRAPWINIKWRLVVFLLMLILVVSVWDYVNFKYSGWRCGVEQFVCSDTVFYWFMVGLVSGIVLIMLAFEGEMAIAVWKQFKHFKLSLPLAKAKKKGRK